MSFFSKEGGESNLQYDDAAFLFFIASVLVLAALVLAAFLIRDLLSLRLPDYAEIRSSVVLALPLQNTCSLRRSVLTSRGFLMKAGLFLGMLAGLWIVREHVHANKQMLRGFDPYQILGLTRDATLKDVKKAYRKLALQYHPDKNVDDPQAQAKFIMISKSYDCFTSEEKRANCFKYGNPDGVNNFKVGIGLPHFFISNEYQFYTLPLVLAILLVLLPLFFIRESSRLRALDSHGISVSSYTGIFSCLREGFSHFTPLYLLASLKEIYEDGEYGPILPEDKVRLFAQLDQIKGARRPPLEDFSDLQLNIFWKIFSYCANLGDLSPSLREKVELYTDRLYDFLFPFTNLGMKGQSLYGNPDWVVAYMGLGVMHFMVQFQRIYFSRKLLSPIHPQGWQHLVNLTEEEMQISLRNEIPHLQPFLHQKQYEKYVTLFSAERQPLLLASFKNLPVYNLEAKMKVAGQVVDQISPQDYAEVYFRVRRTNPTSGYCTLKNYPYLKKEKLYLFFCYEQNVMHFRRITFPPNEDQLIAKFAYRQNVEGVFNFHIFLLSDCYQSLDSRIDFRFRVLDQPQELKNKRVHIHKEDMELEKHNSNFFEQLMAQAIDPEDNQLSDSDTENERPQS